LAPGIVLFTLVSLLGNQLAQSLRYPQLGSAVLFVPYAALTTALVSARPQEWVWYILVGVITHAVAHWGGWPFSWILAADVANVARALVAVLLFARLFRGRPRLDTMGDLQRFVVAAVLIAPAVGATIGATNVVLHGASATYWPPWQQWFMSNALTGLIVLPLFLAGVGAALSWEPAYPTRGQVAEVLLLGAALGMTCLVAFLTPGLARWERALALYAPLPVLIWAALRYGPGAVSLAVTVVAFAAIWSADRGLGPFLVSSPDENVVVLQVFLLLTALPVLCLAIVSTGRRRALRLFRSLLASLEDQVAVLDARGCVLDVNESWRRSASGPSRDFTRARAGEDFLAACDAAADAGNPAALPVATGVRSVLRRERRRFALEYDEEQDGRHQWYALTVEALARADGGAVVIRADVSASRRAQVEAEEQRRESSHLARVVMLGELSGALAHELRQPLASILSNAQAAERLLARKPLDVAELTAVLADIQDEDHRAGKVIDRMRALLRRGETRLQPVESGELLREVLDLCRMELLSRRIVVTSSVEPDVPPMLADRVQLQQVLLNLVLNGCDAMSTTAQDERRLHVAVRRAGQGLVHFSVRDHGTGIPSGMVERMFDPFITSKPQGLGLGLSISRTIVSAHGGRLWAENNEDRGATVHCVVPEVAADGDERDDRIPTPTAAVAAGAAGRDRR
jgi:two-component system, LuxR family, sensor kinase FixL